VAARNGEPVLSQLVFDHAAAPWCRASPERSGKPGHDRSTILGLPLCLCLGRWERTRRDGARRAPCPSVGVVSGTGAAGPDIAVGIGAAWFFRGAVRLLRASTGELGGARASPCGSALWCC
jgi:hypothetical protein